MGSYGLASFLGNGGRNELAFPFTRSRGRPRRNVVEHTGKGGRDGKPPPACLWPPPGKTWDASRMFIMSCVAGIVEQPGPWGGSISRIPPSGSINPSSPWRERTLCISTCVRMNREAGDVRLQRPPLRTIGRICKDVSGQKTPRASLIGWRK